jgi:autotransporter-associated beta strand protein
VTASATTRRLQLRGTTSGTVSGVINNTNTPAVTISGSATWTFTNTNTYAGGTIISGSATAVAGNTAAFGAGAVTLSTNTASIQSLTAGGQNGKLTITGNFTNSAGGVIRIGG